MTKKRTGLNTLAYMGVEATSPPNSVVSDVDPTSEDVSGFDIGSFWITRKTNNVWLMVSKSGNQATWGKLYPDAGGAVSFPCDLGTATQAGGILNIVGDGTSVSTSGAGNSVTIGLSTNVTVAGTLTLTTLGEGVVYSAATGLLSSKNSVNDGEVLISSSVGEPSWSTLTSGANISISENPGTITISIGGIIPIASGGTNTNVMTNTYGANYFDGTGINTTTVGAATQVLTSNGAGVAPTFQPVPGCSGGGLTWSAVAGTSQTMVAGNGYIPTNAALTTFTLPAMDSVHVGDVIAIAGFGAGGWRIDTGLTAGYAVTLNFQSDSVTSGACGLIRACIDSNYSPDCVELVCVEDDFNVPIFVWVVRNAVGNLTLHTV